MGIRVGIVDNEEAIHIAFREILAGEEGLALVGAFKTLQDLHGYLQRERLTILVFGDGTPASEVSHQGQALHTQDDALKIVLLRRTLNKEWVETLPPLGVVGFMLKQEFGEKILRQALPAVAQGGLYLSPQMAQKLIQATQSAATRPLSERQMQVVRMMADYQTTQQMALHLGTSLSAVYGLQYRICRALGVGSPHEIPREARRRGLLNHEDGGGGEGYEPRSH